MAVGKNTIYVAPSTNTCPIQEEAAAATGQSILPGYLLTYNANEEFIAHNVANAGGNWFIANLDEPGQGGTSDVWPVGEIVQAFVPQDGLFFNVVVAASQNITSYTQGLTSNGDGTLSIATGSDVVLFYPDEIINTGATAQLVRVRVAA